MAQEENDVGEEIPPQEPVTFDKFDDLCEQLFAQKAKVEEAKALLKDLNKELGRLQMQAVATLKQIERSSHTSPHGTVGITERWRVSVPKTEADKHALFKYLKEQGVLYTYATVNSNQINSYYNQELEKAQKEGRGMEFRLPGVGESKLFETCSMTKKTSKKKETL